MLLSFSEPSMKQFVIDGLAQANGREITSRVKRQTIRRRGARGVRLLREAETAGPLLWYELHLWWKSRTQEREFFGVAKPAWVYPIHILHSTVEPLDRPKYPLVRVVLPGTVYGEGQNCGFWSATDEGGGLVSKVAHDDGFESVAAFRDYFVPNVGDEFTGILYRW